MKLTPKRFSLVLGVILAICLGLAGVGYFYGARMIGSQTTQLEQGLTQQAQAEADAQALAQAKHQYTKTVEPSLPLIDAALPQTKQSTQILAQLQNLAGSMGLTLSSITLPSPAGLPGPTSQTVAASGVLALPITFQLTGSYSQLQAYLGKVETLNRFSNVTTLSVASGGVGKPITYSINLNVYMKP